MTEPVYFFWALVVFLALAAAFNHGWHHARDAHLSTRLARASSRDDRRSAYGGDVPSGLEIAYLDAEDAGSV